jgi:hypothetical protein
MSEDYAEGGLDFSEMFGDELSEIVDARPGRYPPEMVAGAKHELERRAGGAQSEPRNRERDDAPVESKRPVSAGEAPPPVVPTSVPGGNVPTSVPGGKLFSLGQIIFASLFAGPLGGSLLLAQNYRALGERRAAWRPLAIGVSATALLIVVAYVMPVNTPGTGFGLGGCIGMYYYAKQSQGVAIDNHLRAGGRRGSWALTVVATVGCMVIVFLAGIIAYSFTDAPVAKVRVSRTGQVELNGAKVTREQFRAALAQLSDEGGEVWYYREALEERPSEEVLKTFRLIPEAGLPVRISSKPDFSDYIDDQGNSVPIQ